jgi:hypothetical protein
MYPPHVAYEAIYSAARLSNRSAEFQILAENDPR